MLDCRKCGEIKDFSEFSKQNKKSRGYSYICKSCHNKYNREQWYQKNSEIQKKASADWKKRNHVKVKATRYGISEEYLQSVINSSEGKCQSCGDPYECVDHCHSSGKFRGLLCNPCNKALGFLRDSIYRIDGLRRYLQSVEE